MALPLVTKQVLANCPRLLDIQLDRFDQPHACSFVRPTSSDGTIVKIAAVQRFMAWVLNLWGCLMAVAGLLHSPLFSDLTADACCIHSLNASASDSSTPSTISTIHLFQIFYTHVRSTSPDSLPRIYCQLLRGRTGQRGRPWSSAARLCGDVSRCRHLPFPRLHCL